MAAIDLNKETRAKLHRLVRRRTGPVRVAEPCHIVLLATDGPKNKLIAERMPVALRMAERWRITRDELLYQNADAEPRCIIVRMPTPP